MSGETNTVAQAPIDEKLNKVLPGVVKTIDGIYEQIEKNAGAQMKQAYSEVANWKLLSSEETALLEEDVSVAALVLQAGATTLSLAATYYQSGGHNDNADAFIHTCWFGLMLLNPEVGEAWANKWADARNENNSAIVVEMNKHNYDIGREINSPGSTGVSATQIAGAALWYVVSGQCRRMKGRKLVPTDDTGLSKRARSHKLLAEAASLQQLPDASYFVPYVKDIMRNKGWDLAASFQEQWISGGKAQLDPEGKQKEGLDTNGKELPVRRVEFEWIYEFEEAQEITEELTNVFLNEPGKALLMKRLSKKFVRSSTEKEVIQFGNFLPANPRELEDEYSNSRELDYWALANRLSDYELDELIAAFARVFFAVIPKGTATKEKNTVEVEVTEIGIFFRDSYDFNGKQPLGIGLGFWKLPDKADTYGLISRIRPYPRPANGWIYLTNKDYRDYRDRTQKGEDFIIYSTVKSIPLKEPKKFAYSL